MSSFERKIKPRLNIWWLLVWAALIVAAWFTARAHIRDYWFYDYCSTAAGAPPPAGEHIQLLSTGQKPLTVPLTIEHRELICPQVGMVELNDKACTASFAALPLGPQDFAVILHRLAQTGVSDVAVSSPLTWQQETGDMSREMFCRVMASFPHAVAGLRGRTAAQPDFTPMELRNSAIPAENVQGDARGLPIANRPLPNGLTATPDSLAVVWAPDWLQDEPHTHKPSAIGDMSFPLLVRWNGETIPTLPFRLALMRLGLSPADVQVRIGESITYGGITRPLDRHGRTRLKEASVISLPLDEIVSGTGIREKLGDKACIVLEQPAPGQNTPQRLERLALTVSQLAGTEKVSYENKERIVGNRYLEEASLLNDWQEYAIAISALLLALFILPRFHWILRWPLLSAIPCWLVYEAYKASHQVWVPLSAMLICWLMFFIACSALKPVRRGLFDKVR